MDPNVILKLSVNVVVPHCLLNKEVMLINTHLPLPVITISKLVTGMIETKTTFFCLNVAYY